jgi:YD repeat-containing protein
VIQTTNTDNTTTEAKYDGCGCAGGEVVVTRDEVGRRQKSYADSLGRIWKSQVLYVQPKTEALNGDGDVYSTVINTFNPRDQVTNSKVYQGTETSGTYQETTLAYDGHGRLSQQHAPQQNTGAVTSFTYNADDTTNVVTDGRGATATYGYNKRRLVTSITYTAPSGITNTAPVGFSYDGAGNRTGMTDGFGSMTYNYDTLSRLQWEERSLTNVGTFRLTYGYNLAGQVNSLTDPWGAAVAYAHDATGRVTSVTGTGGGASTYATNMQYRAWGALHHLDYGNSLKLDLTYNNRLQPTEYALKTAGGSTVLGVQYRYTTTTTSTDNDGRVKFSHDLSNSNLDRTYTFDHVGRIQHATSGTLQSSPGGSYWSGPFDQGYSYDVWGNLNGRTWRTFGSYASGWQYDADGRLLQSTDGGTTRQYSYDAAGQMLTSTETGRSVTLGFDGTGRRVKFVENGTTTYYIGSSVLGGQTISEVDQNGAKKRGYVLVGGETVAKQENGQVFWEHSDPLGTSNRTTNSAGTATSKVETDPLGSTVDDTAAYNYSGSTGYNSNPLGFYAAGNQYSSCGVPGLGVAVPCSMVHRRALGWGIGILQITTPVTTTSSRFQLRSRFDGFTSVTVTGAEGGNGSPQIRSSFYGQLVTTTTTTMQTQSVFVGNFWGNYGGGNPPANPGDPQKTKPPQKTLCKDFIVGLPTEIDSFSLMVTLAHEVSPNGREDEAHRIEGAIWNFAYSSNQRQNFQLQEGDIFNAILAPRYIIDPINRPGWTPEDFYKYGTELVEQTLKLPLKDKRGRRNQNNINACGRLQAIINVANNPTRNPDVALDLQHWVGRGDHTDLVP